MPVKKKVLFLLALSWLFFIVLFPCNSFSQPISKYIFGQNAWMPDSVGAVKCWGQLHNKWADIQKSGATIIRFGGIAPDENYPTPYQYLKMIDSIRVKGMEPMIQASFHNYKYTKEQAADLVKYINIEKKRKIKYWIIGNEPNLEYKFTSASQVGPYIKSFASAMKAVDPTILIIGPELAWYDVPIINGITTPDGPDDVTGKDASGNFYLDIISFHAYPLLDGAKTFSEVTTKLTSAGGFEDNIVSLSNRVKTCNTYHSRGSNPIKMGITEANINYNNPANDELYGLGANSFTGGQFWAEMMGIAMKRGVDFFNFWSVIEGNSVQSNIGFMDDNGKKPSYYHFKMLADNFYGNYCSSTDNQTSVKTFASIDSNQVAVLILNQDPTGDYSFNIRLNTETITGNDFLKINVNAGLGKECKGSIPKQSSLILLFDKNGVLKKRIEYKLSGNADLNLPPMETILLTTGNPLQDSPLIVNAYPNPAERDFFIEIDGISDEEVVISISNELGQVVFHKKCRVNDKHLKEKIELEELTHGLHFVQIKGKNQLINNKILVKGI